MTDLWLKEMLALSKVMDDFGEHKMAGRLRVWSERGTALRNEVTELRVEDIRKAYAIVGLQDALGETAGKEGEDDVQYKLSDADEDDLLEKYFKDRL